jgi:hypothetical protein
MYRNIRVVGQNDYAQFFILKEQGYKKQLAPFTVVMEIFNRVKIGELYRVHIVMLDVITVVPVEAYQGVNCTVGTRVAAFYRVGVQADEGHVDLHFRQQAA